jgi:hypothetical protein
MQRALQVEGGFCPMPDLKDLAPNSVGTPGGPNCKKTSKAQENFYLQSELQNFTWVVVLQDGNSKVGASRSASYQLPGRLSEKLLQVGLNRMVHMRYRCMFAVRRRVARQCDSFTREWNLPKLTPKRSGDR